MTPTPSRGSFTTTSTPPAPPTPAPPTGVFATQPVISVTAITTVVSWALGAFVTWGIDLSADKQETLLTGIGILWPIVTAAWAYHKVWSPHSTQRVINEAAVAGRFGDTPPKVAGS